MAAYTGSGASSTTSDKSSSIIGKASEAAARVAGTVEEAAKSAGDKASSMASSVSDAAGRLVDTVEDAAPALRDARESVVKMGGSLDAAIRKAVKDQPFVSLAVIVGLGFAIGALWKK